MAFVHGKNSVFKLDNASGSLTDISAFVNNVDFPDPEGPTIEYTFPVSNLKFILFKTLRDFFSYFFDKLFNFKKLFIF